MAKTGKFSAADLKKLQKKLDKLQTDQTEAFIEACAKELAARLLAKVIKRTPVGDYSQEVQVAAQKDGKKHKKGEVYTKRVNPSGKVGGTLRRGWTSQSHAEAAEGSGKGAVVSTYVDSLKINHFGDTFVIEVANPVEYASYVEYGHRTSNHKGWVRGQFMLTVSEQEVRDIAPNVLEAKINEFLKGVM